MTSAFGQSSLFFILTCIREYTDAQKETILPPKYILMLRVHMCSIIITIPGACSLL